MQNLKKKTEYQRKDRTHEKNKGANKLCQAETPIQNFINEDKLKAKGVSVDGYIRHMGARVFCIGALYGKI